MAGIPAGRPMSAPAGQMMMQNDMQEGTPQQRLTVHEANRMKKAMEQNVKAVQNRIRFFQREEEKIWKDLEEVRRQASAIEGGRARIVEKKLADRHIVQAKEVTKHANRQRAAVMRQAGMEMRRQQQFQQTQAKQLAGQEQRRVSTEMLRQKRMQEAQSRLSNSEKAVAIQRTQLEARLKVNQDRAARLERLREQQESDRVAAETEVHQATSLLPDLEAEEMMCLQRLQNSRIVTQSVLQELESSLGTKSAVVNALRTKHKQQNDHLAGVPELQMHGNGGAGMHYVHDDGFDPHID
eukprot:TRINITY_DN35626_c0_g1_i1.p1 TRINITY_DN35626_c0_g1~~TRINITY_DN35626_c0_g1_i1.p1  ORF type:complete len:330 (+),score=103.91 TRINITY_DN35626_c0_g1_i1:104-991(+)